MREGARQEPDTSAQIRRCADLASPSCPLAQRLDTSILPSPHNTAANGSRRTLFPAVVQTRPADRLVGKIVSCTVEPDPLLLKTDY
jgi:hypothetical protein